MSKLFYTLGFVFISALNYSCTKNNTCFDQDLYNAHKNDNCTTDCPGVMGCDGKSYCNECVANRNGIKVE